MWAGTCRNVPFAFSSHGITLLLSLQFPLITKIIHILVHNLFLCFPVCFAHVSNHNFSTSTFSIIFFSVIVFYLGWAPLPYIALLSTLCVQSRITFDCRPNPASSSTHWLVFFPVHKIFKICLWYFRFNSLISEPALGYTAFHSLISVSVSERFYITFATTSVPY